MLPNIGLPELIIMAVIVLPFVGLAVIGLFAWRILSRRENPSTPSK